MDNFEQQLRRHFDSQRLSPERVQEILAAGRAAAAARQRRAFWRPLLAVAALVVLSLGWWGAGAWWRQPSETPKIVAESVANAVTTFFTPTDYQLSKVSANRRELEDWLSAQGGPGAFEVPAAMAGLSSYGCQVLDVNGQKVYLICFLLEMPAAATPTGAMPEKKMMVTTAPDGTMMKKSVPLVHLVVAAKSQFSSLPKPGERVVLPGQGEWNYATWTRGDQVYIAAGALPAERLAGLVKAL